MHPLRETDNSIIVPNSPCAGADILADCRDLSGRQEKRRTLITCSR